MDMNNEEYYYIYNHKQAFYFIVKGKLIPVDIHKNKKGQLYHKFIKDDYSMKIFNNWCKRKQNAIIQLQNMNFICKK